MAKKSSNKIDNNVNMFSVLDTSDDDNEYIAKEIPVSHESPSYSTSSNKHKGETKLNNKKKQSTEQQQPSPQQKPKKDTIINNKSSPQSSPNISNNSKSTTNANLRPTTSTSTTSSSSSSNNSKNEDKIKLKKIEKEIDGDLQSYYQQDNNKSITNQFLSMFVVVLLIAVVIPFEKLIGYFASRAIAICLVLFLCFQIKEYIVPIFKNNSKNQIITIIKKQQQLRNDKESLSNKLKSTSDPKEKKSIEDQINKLKSEINKLQSDFDRLDNNNNQTQIKQN